MSGLREEGRTTSTAAGIGARTLVLFVAVVVAGWAITSAGFLGVVRRWDDSVNRSLAVHRTPWLSRLALDVSALANPLPVIVVSIGITAVLAVRRRWELIALLPAGILVESTVFYVTSVLIDRPRPAVARIGQVFGTSSFPSGHVAATLVLWTCGSIVLRRLGHRSAATIAVVGGIVMTVSVGWARLYLGMHHPTDVACGLLLGAAACWIACGLVDLQIRRTGNVGVVSR